MWVRLRDAVSKLSAKLHDTEAIFRDSIISNLRDICELIPRLNFTGDADLEYFAAKVISDLGTLDPEDLRKREVDRSRRPGRRIQSFKIWLRIVQFWGEHGH